LRSLYVYLHLCVSIVCADYRIINGWWMMVRQKCCSPWNIEHVIGWEDYTLVMSFVSKGFPYKDQIE